MPVEVANFALLTLDAISEVMGVTPCGKIGNCTCGIHQRCRNPPKKSRLLCEKTAHPVSPTRLQLHRDGSGAL